MKQRIVIGTPFAKWRVANDDGDEQEGYFARTKDLGGIHIALLVGWSSPVFQLVVLSPIPEDDDGELADVGELYSGDEISECQRAYLEFCRGYQRRGRRDSKQFVEGYFEWSSGTGFKLLA